MFDYGYYRRLIAKGDLKKLSNIYFNFGFTKSDKKFILEEATELDCREIMEWISSLPDKK